MGWDEFLRCLEQEIDWKSHDTSDVLALEKLLKEFGNNSQAVVQAINSLSDDSTLFDRYLPHVEYPRPFMDKFILHIDTQDRFRIRIHRFRPGAPMGVDARTPSIHDHRWHFTTFVLSGSYCETIFNEVGNDACPNNYTPKIETCRRLNRGDIKSLSAGILHQTVNDDLTEPCITLFVRGQARAPHSRVWDERAHEFRTLSGRRTQVARELASISDSVGKAAAAVTAAVG